MTRCIVCDARAIGVVDLHIEMPPYGDLPCLEADEELGLCASCLAKLADGANLRGRLDIEDHA